MSVTATPYGKAGLALGNAGINLSSVTLKALLTTSSYTPNVDTHEFLTDITNEITGTGYTAGGVTLSGVGWTYDSANNQSVLAASPAVWTGATFTARLCVVYVSTGTDATSHLLSYVDFGVDKSPAGVDFQVTFVDGVLQLKVV